MFEFLSNCFKLNERKIKTNILKLFELIREEKKESWQLAALTCSDHHHMTVSLAGGPRKRHLSEVPSLPAHQRRQEARGRHVSRAGRWRHLCVRTRQQNRREPVQVFLWGVVGLDICPGLKNNQSLSVLSVFDPS